MTHETFNIKMAIENLLSYCTNKVASPVPKYKVFGIRVTYTIDI